jgi:hypothetical protein
MIKQDYATQHLQDISGLSHNEFAYVLGCYGMKFTLREGHYQTFESFPSRSAPKNDRERRKGKLFWIVQKGTQLMLIKTKATNARKEKERNCYQIIILAS